MASRVWNSVKGMGGLMSNIWWNSEPEIKAEAEARRDAEAEALA